MSNQEIGEAFDPKDYPRSERDRLIKNFKNGTTHKFHDISAEQLRLYLYPDGDIQKIYGPLLLNTQHSSGGHRVFDVQGLSHYVKGGWNRIVWRVYDGEDNFSK